MPKSLSSDNREGMKGSKKLGNMNMERKGSQVKGDMKYLDTF
jgi:hypothetical protein